MPPRGLPTLVLLPPVASSSVGPLSSASFCGATAACRSLALAASPAFRRSSALLAAFFGPSSLSSSPLARTILLTPTPIFAATSCHCSVPHCLRSLALLWKASAPGFPSGMPRDSRRRDYHWCVFLFVVVFPGCLPFFSTFGVAHPPCCEHTPYPPILFSRSSARALDLSLLRTHVRRERDF